MTERLEQQTDDKVSLTLWLSPAVLENINQLVLLRSTRKAIKSKSDVVAEAVGDALKKARAK